MMKKLFLLVLLTSVLGCFSCAGVPEGPGALQPEVPPPAEASRELPSRDAPSLEAPSLEAVFDSGYWVTRPDGSGLTVIGIAGRRANRAEAVKEALADAARKAALYHGLHAESVSVLNQGAGSLDYFSGFDYRITPANGWEGYVDALDYDGDKDVLEKNGVVIVRARYAAPAAMPSYAVSVEDGVPDWTKRYTMDIPGFLVGVGHAANQGSPPRTYRASYEAAIAALLSQLSARVSSEAADMAGARVTRNVTRSEGDLAGVIILEAWLDRKTSAVWTLAAAREQ